MARNYKGGAAQITYNNRKKVANLYTIFIWKSKKWWK